MTHGVKYLPAQTRVRDAASGGSGSANGVVQAAPAPAQAQRLRGGVARSAGGRPGWRAGGPSCQSRRSEATGCASRSASFAPCSARDVADRGVHVAQRAGGALGDRVDRHRVGQGEHQHVGAGLAQAPTMKSRWPITSLDAAVAPQHVVEPGEHADEVRLERERRPQLLLAHLARELAAHGEVGVEQVGLVLREPLRESIRPAAVPSRRGSRSISPSVVLSPRATKRR